MDCVGRALLPANSRQHVKVGRQLGFTGNWKPEARNAVQPRRLYKTANSNPAFAGNSSATFLKRSAKAEGASSG
jgi:hypothetical protein